MDKNNEEENLIFLDDDHYYHVIIKEISIIEGGRTYKTVYSNIFSIELNKLKKKCNVKPSTYTYVKLLNVSLELSK